MQDNITLQIARNQVKCSVSFIYYKFQICLPEFQNKSSRVTTEYPGKFLRCFSTPEDTPFLEKIMSN